MAAMEGGDWRAFLPPDSRSRIVNKITATLNRRLPSNGPEELEELRRIASSFEEKTYAEARCQSDYLRRISLKMLTLEARAVRPDTSSGGSSFNAPPYDSTTKQDLHRLQMAAMEVGDWRAFLPPESRSRIVTKITESLRRQLPGHGPEGLEELRRVASRFEDKIYASAQSQSDYLRRIALKMLTMESRAVGPNASSVAGGSSFNAPPYDEY